MRTKSRLTAGSSANAPLSPFFRTRGDLERQGVGRRFVAILLVLGVLVGWGWWLFKAEMALWDSTDSARIEVDRATHPVESPVAGRVVSVQFRLGQVVKAGDVLVTLDAQAETLQLAEVEVQVAGLAPQIAALKAELAAEVKVIGYAGQAGYASLSETQAKLKEANALAAYSEQEARHTKALHKKGLVPEQELRKAQTEVVRRSAVARSLRATLHRLGWERQTRIGDRKTRVKRLRREITELKGSLAKLRATVARLKHEIALHEIRAPVDGRLGEVADLRVGMMVKPGSKLGTVVPPSKLRIIALFPPHAALGRIKPGQPARLRLHGFPWTQYGVLKAKVSRVGQEVRNGRVRVELALIQPGLSQIPLQHGLPGTLEVQVERISPAALVLRAAGRLITGRDTGGGRP